MKPAVLISIAVANLLLILAIVNGAILHKQQIVSEGETIFLKLAPRDPRSLIQGDYMVLRYEIDRQARSSSEKEADHPTRGQLVLSTDEQGVGTVKGFADDTELGENDRVIQYRRARRGYRFGLESFFFEEGDAKAFEAAQYAEVKLAENGEAVLVGLRGEDLAVIDP